MTTPRLESFDYMIALDSAGKPVAVCEFADNECWSARFKIPISELVPVRAAEYIRRKWHVVITCDGSRIIGARYSASRETATDWCDHHCWAASSLHEHRASESAMRQWCDLAIGKQLTDCVSAEGKLL